MTGSLKCLRSDKGYWPCCVGDDLDIAGYIRKEAALVRALKVSDFIVWAGNLKNIDWDIGYYQIPPPQNNLWPPLNNIWPWMHGVFFFSINIFPSQKKGYCPPLLKSCHLSERFYWPERIFCPSGNWQLSERLQSIFIHWILFIEYYSLNLIR